MNVNNASEEITDYVFEKILKNLQQTSHQVRMEYYSCINYMFYIVLQSSELHDLVTKLLKENYNSKRCLKIINMILPKIYPKLVQLKLLNIDDLLDWELWPEIISTFGMYIHTLSVTKHILIYTMYH